MPVSRLSCRLSHRFSRQVFAAAASAAGASVARAHAASDSVLLVANADPWIVAGLFAAAGLYAAGIVRLRRHARPSAGVPRWRAVCFFAGLAVLAAALMPPLDALGAQLFSMHMLQHELLMLAAAPLIVAGTPLAVFLWAFTPAWRKRIAGRLRGPAIQGPWHALTRPLAAWSLHAGVLWAWHAPRLFQAGLLDNAVHALQHLCFLIAALLFWSSLLGAQSTLRHGTAVLYLLTTLIHTGMLGALLTFSPRAWYPVYAGRTEAWGLSLLEDQQLGGLIMWVPSGFVLLLAGLALAAKAIHPQSARRRA